MAGRATMRRVFIVCACAYLGRHMALVFLGPTARLNRSRHRLRAEDVSKRLSRVSGKRAPPPPSFEEEERGSISGAVGGAVLGGLLLGPFGAIFGANLGSEWGRGRGTSEELDVDEEIVQLAQSAGRELADAIQSRSQVLEIKENLARKVLRLEDEVEELTQKARRAIEADDEDEARSFLEKKYPIQQALESSKSELERALQRVIIVEDNVKKLEKQALEVSSLLERAQQATGAQRTALKAEASAFSVKDPLLDRFDRL